jgi:DNA primase
MTSHDLKEQLTPSLIEKILEDIGCENIKNHHNQKYISSTRKGGDNPNGVLIYTNDKKYNAEMFTSPDFQQRNIRDIIEVVSYIEKISFQGAIKRICDICDINYYDNIIKSKTPTLLKLIAFWESKYNNIDENLKIKVLNENLLQEYYLYPVDKWIKEGIVYDSQKYFNIGFDLETERIIIPIRDELGNLVGIKGRLNKDKDIKGNKYNYLYPCPKSALLFGLFENYQNIIEKNKLIIVESEKSVIKLHGYGFNNVVALSGKILSDIQCEKIMRLGIKDIILCLDNDVKEEEIKIIADKLNYPIKYFNIYSIKDKLNLMKEEKESPCDNIDTFEILIENCLEKI